MNAEDPLEPVRDSVIVSALDTLAPVPPLSAEDRERMVLKIVNAATAARRTGVRVAVWVYAAAWARVVVPAAVAAMILLGALLLRTAPITPRLSLEYVLQSGTPGGFVLLETDDDEVLRCAAAYLPGCAVAEAEWR